MVPKLFGRPMPLSAVAILTFALLAPTTPTLSAAEPDSAARAQHVGRIAVVMWAVLAITAVLFVSIGGIWLIRRLGGTLRRPQRTRPRVAYHDLSLRVVSENGTSESKDANEPDDEPKTD
jgi:hypothetical protein